MHIHNGALTHAHRQTTKISITKASHRASLSVLTVCARPFGAHAFSNAHGRLHDKVIVVSENERDAGSQKTIGTLFGRPDGPVKLGRR